MPLSEQSKLIPFLLPPTSAYFFINSILINQGMPALAPNAYDLLNVLYYYTQRNRDSSI